MPNRSVVVLEAKVHEFGKPNNLINLSKIGPKNQSLLLLFNGFMMALEDNRDRLRNDLRQHYIRITKVDPSSQRVMVLGEPGHFGGGGSTWNVHTHQETRKHKIDDAPGMPVRTMLVVAPDAYVGHVFVERCAGKEIASELLDQFRVAFRRTFPDLNVKFEQVLEPDAWIATAQVEQVQVVDRRYTTDIGDPSDQKKTKVIGRVSHTLLPPKGAKYLPRAVFDLLRSGKVPVDQLVNLQFGDGDGDVALADGTAQADGASIEERDVSVTMSQAGGGKKTFNIDNPRRPRVSYPLEDDSATGSDVEFRNRCFRTAPGLHG